MQAEHQSSSDEKATTPARHLVATAIIGAAMIGYLVHKRLMTAYDLRAWPPWRRTSAN